MADIGFVLIEVYGIDFAAGKSSWLQAD